MDKEIDRTTIEVITSEPLEVRGGGSKQAKQLKVEELAVNINLFIEQMGGILEKTPEKLGKFQFEELEVHADISGTGKVVLFGVGGELGATGGLKFVFRRSSLLSEEE